MSNLTITIHNVVSGEIITREMDADELAAYETNKENIAKEKQLETQNIVKRETAESKLAALGITADDLKALGF
jgi:hypothetical protein